MGVASLCRTNQDAEVDQLGVTRHSHRGRGGATHSRQSTLGKGNNEGERAHSGLGCNRRENLLRRCSRPLFNQQVAKTLIAKGKTREKSLYCLFLSLSRKPVVNRVQ